MDMSLFLQQLLNGLSIGSVYAVFALGYTLIFSILGIINFAHGAVFTVGAYVAWGLMTQSFQNGLLAGLSLPFKLSFPVAALVGAGCAALLSVAIEFCAFRPLRARKADPLLALISSLGIALVLVNGIQLLAGSETQSYPDDILFGLEPVVNIGGAMVRTSQVFIFVVSAVSIAALFAVIRFTKVGKALRAVAENQTTASLLGVSVDRFIVFTFLIAGFLSGLAGILVASSYGISGPYFGVTYGLKGLAVVVLGGLGDIAGGFIGGLVIGLAEAFVPAHLSAYKEAVAFSILFLILLVRPQGLLGKPVITKV